MKKPEFKVERNGFPSPGQVVRYYREKMVYTGDDGHVKRWTQADLARKLGISEWSVRMMETKNQGLDSIERRRTLAQLLNIPYMLLGLATLDELNKLMQQNNEKPISYKEIVDTSDTQLYQEVLEVFKEKYDQGQLNPKIVETWIHRITEKTSYSHKNNINLSILANYHILAANPYYHDLQDWISATKHLNTAKEIAGIIHDDGIFSTSCYYVGEMYLIQDKPLLACKELETGLRIANGQVKGHILADLALAHSLTNPSDTDITYIRNLLDQSEKLVSRDITNTFIKFDTVQYLECKADTLISLKRYKHALSYIDEAEAYLDARSNIIRNTEYLKILQAECYIKQKKPEYEEAVRLLTLVLNNNGYIHYYVKYVARLHKLITASTYSNAPDVVELGMQLRKLQLTR